MTTISIDYETYGEVPLVGASSVGLWTYSRDISTQVLMAAYRIDQGQYQHVDLTCEQFPKELREALLDPHVEKNAFNAGFERVMTKNCLGIDTPYEGWRCSMALANLQSFTGTLGDIGKAMGIAEDQRKDKEGTRLIKLFCEPQKVTRKSALWRRTSRTDPDDWQQFCDYNLQDVIAETAIRDKLLRFEIPEDEWLYYEIDQRINDEGMPVNRRFVERAGAMSERRREELVDEMRERTGLRNPNSTPQLLPWLLVRGYNFVDLQKATVKKELTLHKQDRHLTEDAAWTLRKRQHASRTSVKKYPAILRRLSPDDRLRHAFQFAGAARTARWAGRGPQPHNLTRTPAVLEAEDGDAGKLETCAKLIESGRYLDLGLFMKEPMSALAGSVRSSFQAPAGYELTVCDLSAIESAVTAWLSQCERLLGVFANGLDPYKDFGVELYRKTYGEITKAERTICKPAVLGCFAADTLVLTKNGWLPIVEITPEIQVFDGDKFVEHGGVVDQGEKEVVDLRGVAVTPDHRVLVGENHHWEEACHLLRNTDIVNSAISLASGKLFPQIVPERRVVGSIISVGVPVAELKRSISKILNSAGVRVVVLTEDEALNVDFQTCTTLLRTVLRLRDTMIQLWTSIERITTDITRPVISISFLTQGTTETRTTSDGSNTGENACALRSLPKGTPRDIEIRAQSRERSEKDCLPNRSSQIRPLAKVRTYDIVNSGLRSRFMILTNSGPMLVHNCSYQLGGGTLKNGKRTGLWGYAENMGVEITEEEADRQVKLFRSTYHEIPTFWSLLDGAAKAALMGRPTTVLGLLRFAMDGPYLSVRLPSGRKMYYYKPRVVEKEFEGKDDEKFTRRVMSYMGQNQVTHQWGRVYSSPGKSCENVVQATARDILAMGIRRAHEAGFTLVGSVHDEIITLTRRGDNRLTLELLRECMIADIPWARGLPLGAAGYRASLYRKD